MNLILEWPNDGVTELKYAPLPGAVNMGNKQVFSWFIFSYLR